MNVVIIKYNAGNIQSVLFALERIGVNAIVTDDIATIQAADKIIFPGVGEASTAMKYLQEKNLIAVVKNASQPLLGICLGMQLLCSFSGENSTKCIGVFDEIVTLFKVNNTSIKVPQIGWNGIHNLQTPLFNNVPENAFCYFVHSYYVPLNTNAIATANYTLPYAAALQKDNFYGVQFHPEKSAAVGEQILKNFIELI